MSKIEEVWFGKPNLSNVVVKLVQINHDSDTKCGDSRGKKPADCACARSKKRGLDSDGDRNITVLAIFHLHLNTLRSSGSKYFETYFSDRWSPDHSQPQPMELFLEAQADVGHYEDCFSTMYEWTSTKFESVTHCVGMLKVAVQLLYEPVIEDGVRYLSTMQWSKFEFKLVRKLIAGTEGGFPLDSANDVLARLGSTHRLVGDDNEHEGISNKAQELAETALKRVFVDAVDYLQDPTLANSRKLLFTETFKQLITRPLPNALTKFALDLINVELKSTSVDLVQCGQAYMRGAYDSMRLEFGVKKFDWLLNILLQNKVAKEAVEFIVHDNEGLMTVLPYFYNPYLLLRPNMGLGRAKVLQQFAGTLCSIFVEVAQGRLLLTADSRLTLIQGLSWLMLHTFDQGDAQWTSAKMSITELTGNLPLVDQALLFENLETNLESQVILDEAYNNWFNRVMREYDPEMLDS